MKQRWKSTRNAALVLAVVGSIMLLGPLLASTQRWEWYRNRRRYGLSWWQALL